MQPRVLDLTVQVLNATNNLPSKLPALDMVEVVILEPVAKTAATKS